MTMTDSWPRSFQPETAPVYTYNEIRSVLPAEVLWPRLIAVTRWPQWYPHAEDVRTTDGLPEIGPASTFSWTTLRVRVKTTVTEFEPARRLAWRGTGPGSQGYHRWRFTPAENGGCLVVTEEVQTGFVPRLLASRLKRNLTAYHQVWLEQLIRPEV
jgi:hypothetical protein